jgi:hypothetical protein
MTISEPDAASAGVQALPSILAEDAYSSLAFAKLEDDAVWTREWICIGVADDVPNPGDMLPFTIGDHAIHVQRLASGRLAGRFNLAQHGGCRVVPLQCRQGAKTSCSFTSCGHSRDRAPIVAEEMSVDGQPTPEMYQYLGLRPERLLGVRVAQHGPFLFAHLDLAGEPFAPSSAQMHAALPDALACVDVDANANANADVKRCGDEWIELPGNWKQVGQGLVRGPILSSPSSACAVFGQDDGSGLRAVWAYPNLIVLSEGASVCALVLQPVALQRTLCRVSVFGKKTLQAWHAVIVQRGAVIVDNERAKPDERANEAANERPNEGADKRPDQDDRENSPAYGSPNARHDAIADVRAWFETLLATSVKWHTGRTVLAAVPPLSRFGASPSTPSSFSESLSESRI